MVARVWALIPFAVAGALIAVSAAPDGPAPPPAPREWPIVAEDASAHHGSEVQIVGDVPPDADSVLFICETTRASVACVTEALKRVLSKEGSRVAFDVLEAVADKDSGIEASAHGVAHDLGRYAVTVYPTIQQTLLDCSTKVFQGCYHGALQAYFEGFPQVMPEDVRGLCPTEPRFVAYHCAHGIGHGVTLAAKFDLERSLAPCEGLETARDRHSCYQGAFMENAVSYMNAGSEGHAHAADGETPRFWVRGDDPAYPCNAVAERHVGACWFTQVPLVLYNNDGDFPATFRLCATLASPYQETCNMAVGREAWNAASHELEGVVERCSLVEADARQYCIYGYVDAVILNLADPAPALPLCRALPAEDKETCYFVLGREGSGIVSRQAMLALCAQAEPEYEAACLAGVGPEPS